MTKKPLLIALFVFMLLTLPAAPAPAQTPDGQTPAVETVCAGQIGAAFGLCSAYCEAMDCDTSAPQASATACSRVRKNFMRVSGQAPPCECPCAAGYISVIQSAASSGLSPSGCGVGENESQVHFGEGIVPRLNLVYYAGQAAYCTAWNADSELIASVSDLTARQVAACLGIISNVCQ